MCLCVCSSTNRWEIEQNWCLRVVLCATENSMLVQNLFWVFVSSNGLKSLECLNWQDPNWLQIKNFHSMMVKVCNWSENRMRFELWCLVCADHSIYQLLDVGCAHRSINAKTIYLPALVGKDGVNALQNFSFSVTLKRMVIHNLKNMRE